MPQEIFQAISSAAQQKLLAGIVLDLVCPGIYRVVLTDGSLSQLLNATRADDLSI